MPDPVRLVQQLGRASVAANAPDRLWHTDIKQVDTLDGPLYLASLVDGCSRACVGWAMAEQQRTELVCDALAMAVARRRPDAGWSIMASRDRRKSRAR